MGTTCIIAVKLNKKVKLAQPIFHDGYPSHEGVEVLKFLLKDLVKDKFIQKVQNLRFAESEQEKIDSEQRQWDFRGSKILKYIQSRKDNIVFDATEYDGSIPTCFEFGYLIDLDKNTFEVYSETITSRKNYNASKSNEFRDFNLLRRYDLNNLPTIEQFMDTFDLA
ncbi:hypothetical protein J6O86_03000 [bacterium]|nr:hypothetical protein [bacterium]